MKYQIKSLWDPSELGDGSHIWDHIGKLGREVRSRIENSMHYDIGRERYKMIWVSLRRNFPGVSIPRTLNRAIGRGI